MGFFRKHKWYVIVSLAIVVAFAGAALWLYFATDTPQLGPFQYQVF